MAGERVGFDDSVAANVAAGDAFAARIRGLPAPPFEADPTDAPVALDPPATLDLRAEELASVIWCTGFGGDFSYLDPAPLDPVAGFEAWAASAARLQAWHDGGDRGPRPPGRIRPHQVELARALKGHWAQALYRVAIDPDGRPLPLRRDTSI